MFPFPTVASGAFFGSDWQPERFIHQNHLAEGYAGHRGYVSFREGNIPSCFQNLDLFPLFSLLSIFFGHIRHTYHLGAAIQLRKLHCNLKLYSQHAKNMALDF